MKNIIILFALLLLVKIARAQEVSAYYNNYFDGPALQYQQNSKRFIDKDYVIDNFEFYMEDKIYPTTDEFIEFLQELISPNCYGTYLYDKCHVSFYHHALNVLRSEQRIDNLFYLIVSDRIKNFKPNLKDLSTYLRSLKSIYRKRLSSSNDVVGSDLSFLNSRNLSQKFGPYKGLTPRQVLYLKYDSFQIKHLAYQLKKMINIMSSKEAYIYINMQSTDLSDVRIDLSYSEKYRLGVKLLKFHLNELTLDNKFGFKPLFIDVLLAGVETGVIQPDILEGFYMMPEFYDSYRNRYKRYKEIILKIGKQILINTPYIGQISLIPIMIFEIRNELKNKNRGNSNDTHLF